MALKTYLSRHLFEAEREAFLGLRDRVDVPIIRYLGNYTHTCEDGNEQTGTFNLLLEYGVADLDEYWADPTNAPPVMTQEIIRYWQSMFKIADAIDSVHNLQIHNSKYKG